MKTKNLITVTSPPLANCYVQSIIYRNEGLPIQQHTHFFDTEQRCYTKPVVAVITPRQSYQLPWWNSATARAQAHIEDPNTKLQRTIRASVTEWG